MDTSYFSRTDILHRLHHVHDLHTSQVIEQPVQIGYLPGHLPCLVSLHLIDQRLTHQSYDQPVALDGAHALFQLEQDLVLVLDVAALCLPIGERGGLGP